MASSSEEDAYGPPLPPGFKFKGKQKEEDPSSVGGDEDEYLPALPPHLSKPASKLTEPKMNEKDEGCESDDSDSDYYGPALPPHLQKNTKTKSEEIHTLKENEDGEVYHNRETEKVTDEADSDDDMYGPAPPPHLLKKNNSNSVPSVKRIHGPSLPPGFIPPESSHTVPEPGEESHEDDDDDDDGVAVGPMPSSVPFNEEEYRIQQLELRAKKMKDKLEGKCEENKPVQRETWMLELPEDRPNFCGLAPRQFRKKAPQEKGDRSVWTDTPSDKAKKALMNKEEVQKEITPENIASKQRDDDLAARVDKYNKEKRSIPLIDLHTKKLKKNEESSGPKERRPFSREEDMNVNKFDDAQKSSILKKARQLNDRFNPGDKKFL